MNPTVKNALIFIGGGCILILAYLYFFNKEETPPLVSTSDYLTGGSESELAVASSVAEFLPVLLNIRNIQLDDSIFLDPTFIGLKDSSIELVPDGTEGRPNPFAPIGIDIPTTTPPATVPNSPNSSNTPASATIPSSGGQQ